MNELLGITAALISGLFFALKDVFSKKAMAKTGFTRSLFYIYFLAWIPVAFYFLFFDYRVFSVQDLQLGAFIGLGLAVGYFLFFKALEAGKVSLAGPVSELWVVFTIIAAFFVLGETIRFLQAVGLVLSFAALFLMAGKEKTDFKSVLYAFAAAVAWGFTWFAVKPLVDSVGTVAAYFLYVGVGVVLFFAYLVLERKTGLPDKSVLLPSAFLLSAYLIEVWGVDVSTVSLVSTAYSPAYVLSVVVLTRFLLGEKLKKNHYVGIVLILLAIMLIATG